MDTQRKHHSRSRGTGSVRRRHRRGCARGTRCRCNRWSALVTLQGGGQQWLGTFESKDDAEQAVRSWLKDAAEGKPMPKLTTDIVAEFLERWLETIRVRPSSLASYTTNVRRRIVPRLGNMKVRDVDTATLNRFYRELEASGLSPRSVRYAHATLSKAFGDAVRARTLAWNPASVASPPKQLAAEVGEPWAPEELRRFLTHVRTDRLYAMWHLFATTGARRGEVIGLRHRDLALDEERINVAQSLVTVNNRVLTSEPKTAKGRRSIALDAETVSAIRAHLKTQAEERLARGLGKPSGDDLIFTTDDGAPLHPTWVTKAFPKHVKKAGLRQTRLHDVRHAYATAALAAGISPKTVSERLGHSRVSFTLDRYTHVLDRVHEEAADKVASLILGSETGS